MQTIDVTYRPPLLFIAQAARVHVARHASDLLGYLFIVLMAGIQGE